VQGFFEAQEDKEEKEFSHILIWLGFRVVKSLLFLVVNTISIAPKPPNIHTFTLISIEIYSMPFILGCDIQFCTRVHYFPLLLV
jgi:hypothetical protein